MDWLRIVCIIIPITIYGYLLFQGSRFDNELRKATNNDRDISKRFVRKWNSRFSRDIILLIIASIFGILAMFLSY